MAEFWFVSSAMAFFLSLAACFFAARNASLLRALQAASADLPISRLRSIADSLDALSVRQEETEEALKLLANKLKMMRVRGSLTHTDGPSKADPDPHTEPDKWRAWMNAKLSRNRLGL
jgi:cytochrome c biogenesis protein ResB